MAAKPEDVLLRKEVHLLVLAAAPGRAAHLAAAALRIGKAVLAAPPAALCEPPVL